MNEYSLYDRIFGSLITAGIGDALGGPTEALSRAEIKEQFGRITKFEDPSSNLVSPDNHTGEITDDTSQLFEMAKAVARSGGDFTIAHAAEALVIWSQSYPKYYPRNAGPTTMHVIKSLLEGADPAEIGKTGKKYGRGTSNGAVMRVAAAGLINPGNLDGAVHTAIEMTAPSHGTQHAFSGAAAVACAIAEAMTEHSTVWSVLRAALYGAEKGEEIGMKEARVASGVHTHAQIITAIDTALKTKTMEEAEAALESVINCEDISVQGTTALALGLFAAANGDSMKAILGGANIGGDTDTIACVAGMIAGAFNGCSAIPKDLYAQFKEANPAIDFEGVAKDLTAIAEKRMG